MASRRGRRRQPLFYNEAGIVGGGSIPAYHSASHESGGADALALGSIAGTVGNAQVPQGVVTQHQAALAIAFTQLTGSIADGQVPESAVTQHQAALSIVATQVSAGAFPDSYTIVGTLGVGGALTVEYTHDGTSPLLYLQNLSDAVTTLHEVEILAKMATTGGTARSAGGIVWRKKQEWTDGTSALNDTYLDLYTVRNDALYKVAGFSESGIATFYGSVISTGGISAQSMGIGGEPSGAVGLLFTGDIAAGADQYGLRYQNTFDATANSWALDLSPTWAAVSGYNYGLHISDVVNAVTGNYAIYTNAGLVRFGDAVTMTGTLGVTGVATLSNTLSVNAVAQIGNLRSDDRACFMRLGVNATTQYALLTDVANTYVNAGTTLHFRAVNAERMTLTTTLLAITTAAVTMASTLDVTGRATFTSYIAANAGIDRGGVATSLVRFSGGSSTILGANMVLYGETHATDPFDILFRANSTEKLKYDHSEGRWEFTPSVTMASTLGVTGTITSRAIQPISDETYSLGTPSFRWNTVYTKFLNVESTATMAGGSWSGTVIFNGLLTTAASASGSARLNLPHGTAPTSPNDGDVWTTTAGLYVRVNGSTIGPLS